MLHPPCELRHLPRRLRWLGTDGGHRPPNPLADAHMAERNTIVATARVTRAERADWPAKAEAGP